MQTYMKWILGGVGVVAVTAIVHKIRHPQSLGKALPNSSICCTECHFSFEEREALPFLTPKLQAELLKEHKDLEARGFPEKDMLAHSEREIVWFEEANVPPDILARIREDHRTLLS